MAAMKQESPAASYNTPQSSCSDGFDMNSFVNLDYDTNNTPILSPSNSFKLKNEPGHGSFIDRHNNSLLPPVSRSQLLPAPSHQYTLYPQQTSLAPGAYAAVNQVSDFSSPNGLQDYGYVPNAYRFGMNTIDDDFDFGSASNQSFPPIPEEIEDYDSLMEEPLSASLDSTFGDFINPNAIGTPEDVSSTTRFPSASRRLYPGVHQEQAAQAKALAEAEKQVKQQQQTLTVPHQQSRQLASRAHGGPSRPPTDPFTEERISRLLNEMRHSSVASSNDDDAATPNANGLPHIARSRREDDEMDEDERLLASEEGKKLSSKERRQLRNKVSARAFRSRRKEYIGQLEGEVAAKSNEAEELRAQNEALRVENTRLTDLTRLLLSSPSFSSFLDDMSRTNPTTSSSASTQQQTLPTESKTSQIQGHKDVNPHQLPSQPMLDSQHGNAQIGMALTPEQTVDFASFESNNNWTNTMDFGFNNAQVFTVTDLPYGPAVDQIDIGLLSGKESNTVGYYTSSDDAKDDTPVVKHMPLCQKITEPAYVYESCFECVEFDESDPAFALYADSSSLSTAKISMSDEAFLPGATLAKTIYQLEVITENEGKAGTVDGTTLARFERLCSSIEAASEKVGSMTSHL